MSNFDQDAPLFESCAGKAAQRADRSTDHDGPTSNPAQRLAYLQRTAGNRSVAQLFGSEDDRDSVDRATQSGGTQISPEVRAPMERAFGADFTSVRLHTDADADASAQHLNAHAYTVGDDIVFANGRFDPASATGQRTLAHELTHVVQQRSGPVDGTPTGAGINMSDPSDRFEIAAESMADRVISQHLADAAMTASATARLDVDRSASDDVAQVSAIQREDIDEEDDPAPLE